MGQLHEESATGKVAVIGISGRFLSKSRLADFWQALLDGEELIKRYSDTELLNRGVEPHLLEDPSYVKAGGPLKDEYGFDAEFFRFTEREATFMDPQHRRFLECCYEALESAGYNPEISKQKIGVFGGVSINTYFLNNILRHYQEVNLDFMPFLENLISSDKDFLTTKVSYKLNLRGPSVNVQSACSTALVSIHLACRSLLHNECDLCLAGAGSIRFPHGVGYKYVENGIVSPDGHCRTFDEQAQGTIFASGVGVVLLKRLERAVADGDNILAVIRASAVNNDGAGKMSYTASTIDAQTENIKNAIHQAGIDPREVEYIEFHGTGTKLGDPIEYQAVSNAYHLNETTGNRRVYIGSVKTNVGHLDVASGIVGLIKTIYCLRDKKIPPVLHFSKANEKLTINKAVVQINTGTENWNTSRQTRLAAVNSLGVGGTNAHVILEEAPVLENSPVYGAWYALPFSALRKADLKVIIDDFIGLIEKEHRLFLPDVSFTYKVGKRQLKYRKVLLTDDLNRELEQKDDLQFIEPFSEKIKQLLFQFLDFDPNEGVIRDLYQTSSLFQKYLHDLVEELARLIPLDAEMILTALLENNPITINGKTDHHYLVHEFCLNYSLAKILTDCNAAPKYFIANQVGLILSGLLLNLIDVNAAFRLLLAATELHSEITPDSKPLPVFNLSNLKVFYLESGHLIPGAQVHLCREWQDRIKIDCNIDDKTYAKLIHHKSSLIIQIGNGGKVEPSDYRLLGQPGDEKSFQYSIEKCLAELWLGGLDIDWEAYYRQECRRRIITPTYPFHHNSYFFHHEQHQKDIHPGLPHDLQKLLYGLVWVEAGSGAKELPGDRGSDNLVWGLVSFQRNDSSSYLENFLLEQGITPFLIREEDFKDSAKVSQVLNKIDRLLFADYPIDIHNVNKTDLFKIYHHEFIGKIFPIIKVLLGLNTKLMMSFITKNACSLGPEDTVEGFYQSMVHGMVKAIRSEYPMIACNVIDIDDQEIECHFQTLVAVIKGNTTETIAVRKGKVFKKRLQHFVPQTTLAQSDPISPKATYLITGGYGAIGKECIQYLLKNGAKTFAVINRNSKKNQEFEHYLSHKGIQVHSFDCDLSNYDQLKQIFSYIQEHLPPLKGIIHSAGAIQDDLIINQNYQSFETVFKPKVYGVWNLHLLTQFLPLDFFILFSTSNTILESEGQINYLVANYYIDSFVSYRRKQNLAASVINWGPWEIGMAESLIPYYQENGIEVLSKSEGIKILDYSLKHDILQLFAFHVHWNKVKLNESLQEFCHGKISALDSASQNFFNQISSLDRDKIREKLIGVLIEKVAELLKRNPHDIDENSGFYDLGIDSLLAIEFRQVLHKTTNLKLSATVSFDYPNIQLLANYLIDQHFMLDTQSEIKNDKVAVTIDKPSSGLTLEDILNMDEARAEELYRNSVTRT